MKYTLLLLVISLVFTSLECSTLSPPEVTLSDYLWQETAQQHQAALGSSFIQGLRTVSLDPTNFGAFMVQDSVYCYKVKNNLGLAESRVNNNPILKQFLKDRSNSYERYYEELAQAWHISNPNGIRLGTAISGYVDHLDNVATTMDPIYLVAALIPCGRLWPWLGGQIGAKTGNFGVYKQWVTQNLDPGYHGYRKYEKVINDAFRAGLIDKQTALRVYKRSMKGEVDFFSSV